MALSREEFERHWKSRARNDIQHNRLISSDSLEEGQDWLAGVGWKRIS
jgi:hypothetical protein